jgi:succinylarginine dihydrolase
MDPSSMQGQEINFDGLVGPTHHYGGLSYGNIASIEHRGETSNPKEAALESLKKMKLLFDMGIKQAVLPPHERPDVLTLRRLGFRGLDSEIVKRVSQQAPELLAACSSAASMWTANAATVAPSADTVDGKVHLTPANLSAQFHRSNEHETTRRVLRVIFSDDAFFVHHPALPSVVWLGDEGAANHIRFCETYGKQGVHLFVFGKDALRPTAPGPRRFPARQTREASEAIARLHQLDPKRVVFAQQTPEVIDAGVFHNDVISAGNQNLFFFHERAFVDSKILMEELNAQFHRISGKPLVCVKVPSKQISVETAVKTYLFNSQIISLPDEGMALIAPVECRELVPVRDFLEGIVAGDDNPVRKVQYVDLRQSMQNGGGPACLRLRIVLTGEELARSNPMIYLDETLYTELCHWVKKHYRDRLTRNDLADPLLLSESRTALDELTQTLNLGSVYPFQLNE